MKICRKLFLLRLFCLNDDDAAGIAAALVFVFTLNLFHFYFTFIYSYSCFFFMIFYCVNMRDIFTLCSNCFHSANIHATNFKTRKQCNRMKNILCLCFRSEFFSVSVCISCGRNKLATFFKAIWSGVKIFIEMKHTIFHLRRHAHSKWQQRKRVQ